jgi:hypothetical protein
MFANDKDLKSATSDPIAYYRDGVVRLDKQYKNSILHCCGFIIDLRTTGESIPVAECLKANPPVHVDMVNAGIYDLSPNLAIITNKSFLTDPKGLAKVDVFVSSPYLEGDVQFTIMRQMEQKFPLFVTYEHDLRKAAGTIETDKIDLALIPLRSEFVQVSGIRFVNEKKTKNKATPIPTVNEICRALARRALFTAQILDEREWRSEVLVGSTLHMFGDTGIFAIHGHSSALYHPSSVGSLPTIHIPPDDVIIWKPSYNFFSGGPVISMIRESKYGYLAGINYPSKHHQLDVEHPAPMHRSWLIYGLIRAYKWHYLLHDPKIRAHVTLGDPVPVTPQTTQKTIEKEGPPTKSDVEVMKKIITIPPQIIESSSSSSTSDTHGPSSKNLATVGLPTTVTFVPEGYHPRAGQILDVGVGQKK